MRLKWGADGTENRGCVKKGGMKTGGGKKENRSLSGDVLKCIQIGAQTEVYDVRRLYMYTAVGSQRSVAAARYVIAGLCAAG